MSVKILSTFIGKTRVVRGSGEEVRIANGMRDTKVAIGVLFSIIGGGIRLVKIPFRGAS